MESVKCLICLGQEEVQFHWEVVKRLRGDNRAAAISFLVQRDGQEDPETHERTIHCGICHEALPESLLKTNVNVHHLDEVSTHNHRFNLQLTCHGCNSSVSQQHWRSTRQRSRASLPERENNNNERSILETSKTSQPARSNPASESENVLVVGVGSEVEADWSSREGADSVKMNAAIDDWLGDLVKGPFVVHQEGSAFLVPVEIKQLAIMGAAMLKQHPKIKHGSQITVERYLWARSLGPTLGEPGELSITPDTRTGIKYVTYRGRNKLIEKPAEEQKQETTVTPEVKVAKPSDSRTATQVVQELKDLLGPEVKAAKPVTSNDHRTTPEILRDLKKLVDRSSEVS